MERMHLSLHWAITLTFLLAGSASAAKPVALDKDPNLAGWWKFDEKAGKTAADASAHKRNGTLKGNLSFEKHSVPGKAGKAIKLDGGETFVEVTGYKGVTGTQARTVTAWIKTATTRGQITSWGTNDFGQMWNFGFVRGRIGVTPHGGYFYMNPIAEIHDIGLLDLWPLETGDELDVTIGRRFKGCLDDLRIYDRALSDEEIQVLFQLKSDRPVPKAKK